MKVLLVEDSRETLDQLQQCLTSQSRQWEVATALSQDEACSLIEKARRRQLPYDMVVLDLGLPHREGGPLESNERIFQHLRKSGHESVVVHISAYPDSPLLMKSVLSETMRSPIGPRSIFLPKTDSDWALQVARIAQQVQEARYTAPNPVPSIHGSRFCSCFISHSHEDEAFVKKLYISLKANGVEAWFAPEALRPGRKVHQEIEHAVQVYDKFLLVLSEDSMKSNWVATEIRTAMAEESKTGRRKLVPIRLAKYASIMKWKCFNADSGKDMAAELREYFIPNFRNWQREAEFSQDLNRLLEALRL